MLARLLQVINEQHGTAFTLVGRYATGEQGAYAISESDSTDHRRFVLKWAPGIQVPHSLRQTVAITGRLRALGYPAPRYRLVGAAPALGLIYSVQEELPGSPLGGQLDQSLLDQVLELNAVQREQIAAALIPWPGPVADPVLHGGDGFCLLDPLRSYSVATADLLEVLQHLVIIGRSESTPINDVVHFDFQGANILVDGNTISGVVDWEGCCAGDGAFDLATLFFYASAEATADADQLERLWRLLVARTGPRVLGVYLAHLMLRQVDWSIRFHDRDAVARWLGHADSVLARLSAVPEQGGVN